MFTRLSSLFITLSIVTASILATSALNPRDSPPISTLPGGSTVFTDGVAGCTNGSGGSYTFTWGSGSSSSALLCGKGWTIGTNRTISYAGSYSPNGYSKFTMYGWTRNPLVEYMVMESFGGSVNPAAGAIRKGTTTCNGQIYDILQMIRVNQPSIDGVQTFQQYWSARRDAPKLGQISGKVDMDCHFKAWAAFNMTLGSSHAYQIAAVDAYFSNGNAAITVS
ncbi:hypothetical protein CVT24_012900 [Panaeolus cyanescens]|uniref:Endo-1,4-beta-xylanase n=1 Tax=Panaeolus cyanescens TaxID=181874 RepID=A0A409W2S1_9AGAR|nr:hypothetical protein CVT24_012900 [Panaeolus cyanescens]